MATARSNTQSDAITLGESVRRFLDMPVVNLIGVALVFLVAALVSIDIQKDNSKLGLDNQVKLKLLVLACFGLYGIWGTLTSSKIQGLLFSFPVLWMVALFGFFFMSIPFAYGGKVEALASTATILIVLLGTLSALTHLGVFAVLNSIFFAAGSYCVGSWIVYLAMPEIGIFAEPLPGGAFVERMSGLAHPNTLGQMSAFCIILGVVLRVTYGVKSYLRNAIILLAVGALVMSLSRTSLAATVIAVSFAYRNVFLQGRYLQYYIWLGFFGLISFMALMIVADVPRMIENRMATVTKSGDTSELTSATGRAEIWEYSLKQILKRPLFGYAPGASKHLLRDHSLYTHNLVLNVMMSTGLLGGLTALAMLISRALQMFRRPHPLADAIVMFVLVNGLVENLIFSILTGMPTMLWIIALVWWRFEEDPAVSLAEGEFSQ